MAASSTILARLAAMVQRTDTRAGRLFDLVVVGLVVLAVVVITIETLPGLPAGVYALLRVVEVLLAVLFTLEYALRIYTAPVKRAYVFSFFGLVDLLAIAPFYILLGGGGEFVSMRALRLLRLARVLKLTSYSEAARRYIHAFRMAKEEIVIFISMMVLLIFMAASGIYYFEHEAQPELFKSIPHSLWWAVVTLTTVGYGDMYPITTGGRALTVVLLMISLCLIAVPAGIVASTFTEIFAREKLARDKRKHRAEQHDSEH